MARSPLRRSHEVRPLLSSMTIGVLAVLLLCGPTSLHAVQYKLHQVWIGKLTTADGVARLRIVLTGGDQYGAGGRLRCTGTICPSRRGRVVLGGEPTGDPFNFSLVFRDDRTIYACDTHGGSRKQGGPCLRREDYPLSDSDGGTLKLRRIE